MANLYYFFHFHRGGMMDKTIKIAGSFLAAVMLFTWSFSDIVAVSAEETAQINSQMIPESGYRPEAQQGATSGAPRIEPNGAMTPPSGQGMGPGTDSQQGMPGQQGNTMMQQPVMNGRPGMMLPPGGMRNDMRQGDTMQRGDGQRPSDMGHMQKPLMEGMRGDMKGNMKDQSKDQGGMQQFMNGTSTDGKKMGSQGQDMGQGMSNVGKSNQKGMGADKQSSSMMGQPGDNGNGDNNNQDNQQNQDQMNKQRLAQELPRTLREISQMQRELGRLCNQLKRLKGTEDDLVSCTALQDKLQGYVDAIKSSADDDALQTAMEDYHDSNIWDEISKVRFKIEVPKMLNRMVIELARADKLLNQKALQTLVDITAIREKLAEVKTFHEAMKTCYQQGDFECVQEKMDEMRDQNPMELFGVLQMLRGLNEMSRYIKDKDTKAEIQGLIDPVIQSINAGDWQQARQDLEAIQKELQDIMKSIMMSQRNRGGGASSVVQERLDKLKAKYQKDDASPQGGGNDQGAMDTTQIPTTVSQP